MCDRIGSSVLTTGSFRKRKGQVPGHDDGHARTLNSRDSLMNFIIFVL